MADDLAQRVLRGERAAVARAIRLLDDRHPAGPPLLRTLYPAAAPTPVVGLTGGPGAGKSSLADRLIEAWRARGRSVGVAAVDPSSPFSGGAILGDRIRMQRHAADDGVFIRSLATRGHLGGLSASARDVVAVLAAAGFSAVLLETVGVGQGEVEVARVAHTVVLVVNPGGGDAVQTLKAGILEIADVFAVNKIDLPGADRTAHDLQQMLALDQTLHPDPERWLPPVVHTCAHDRRGIDDLVAAIDRHQEHLRRTPAGRAALRDRSHAALLDALRTRLEERILDRRPAAVAAALDRLVEGRSDPYSEADALLAAAERNDAASDSIAGNDTSSE